MMGMGEGLITPAEHALVLAEARHPLDALGRDEWPLLQLSVRHLPRHLSALDEAGERDQ
jgi:hypothetical protein